MKFLKIVLTIVLVKLCSVLAARHEYYTNWQFPNDHINYGHNIQNPNIYEYGIYNHDTHNRNMHNHDSHFFHDINNIHHYTTKTLELVHVLFRHGNRTIDTISQYPNDPYINETYYPYGYGQLTNGGKLRMYRVGKSLRQRYDDFLGDVYTPDILDAVSTDVNRTKMSLELVLAGLFPPRNTILEWEEELNWQPIPYNYLPSSDHLLSIALFNCPNYAKLYEEYLKTSEGIKILQRHSKLFNYLSEQTGMTIAKPIDAFLLHAGFSSEEEFGLKLPSWTDKIYPEYLESAVIDYYRAASATTELKQLSAGFLLRKIIKDTQAKIDGQLKNRKIFLYSAHDFNIGYLLNALEVYFPHTAPYGAYILIEVHRVNGVYGMKVFYQDYKQAQPKILTVPGCDHFCPFERFVTLLIKNVPTNDDACENTPKEG